MEMSYVVLRCRTGQQVRYGCTACKLLYAEPEKLCLHQQQKGCTQIPVELQELKHAAAELPTATEKHEQQAQQQQQSVEAQAAPLPPAAPAADPQQQAAPAMPNGVHHANGPQPPAPSPTQPPLPNGVSEGTTQHGAQPSPSPAPTPTPTPAPIRPAQAAQAACDTPSPPPPPPPAPQPQPQLPAAQAAQAVDPEPQAAPPPPPPPPAHPPRPFWAGSDRDGVLHAALLKHFADDPRLFDLHLGRDGLKELAAAPALQGGEQRVVHIALEGFKPQEDKSCGMCFATGLQALLHGSRPGETARYTAYESWHVGADGRLHNLKEHYTPTCKTTAPGLAKPTTEYVLIPEGYDGSVLRINDYFCAFPKEDAGQVKELVVVWESEGGGGGAKGPPAAPTVDTGSPMASKKMFTEMAKCARFTGEGAWRLEKLFETETPAQRYFKTFLGGSLVAARIAPADTEAPGYLSVDERGAMSAALGGRDPRQRRAFERSMKILCG